MGTLIGKGFLLHIVMMVVCLLVSGIGNVYVSVGLTFLLFAGYVIFMYAEGAQAGEAQCTMTDTVRKIREDGKTPSNDQIRRCFNPKNGIIACVILSLPSLIIAIANLITADPAGVKQNIIGVAARIWFLPEIFVTRLCTELVKTDISGMTKAASTVIGSFNQGTLNVQSLITSTAALGGAYTVVTDYTALKLLNLLYIPISLIPPIAMLIGYLRGPKLRAKTLNDMLTGSNKKLRKMKKNRSHAPRVQKPEI